MTCLVKPVKRQTLAINASDVRFYAVMCVCKLSWQQYSKQKALSILKTFFLSTLSLLECLMDFCKVTLIFESVDEIL